MRKNITFKTAGGRITCIQCQAMSKRTKHQCRAPAIKGRAVCRFHGGRSTGPRTLEGRLRIADAMTAHGNETRSARIIRSVTLAELEAFDALGRTLGMIKGPRKRGPKCKIVVEIPGLDLVAQRIFPPAYSPPLTHPTPAPSKRKK